MKAIVLAAGYGTRLKPLTEIKPKPLMPVLGKPLILHIIDKLKSSGVTDIGINIHHNFQMLEEFISHENTGLNIKISVENKILGVGGGIGGFRGFLSEEDFFIVHNGDILTSMPIDRAIQEYKDKKPLCIMLLHDCGTYNNVSLDATGTVVDIRDTLQAKNTSRKLAYTGIALMYRQILKYIPQGVSDLVPVIIDIIKEKKGGVRGVVFKNYPWRDIGTISGYLETHKDILVKKLPLIEDNLMPSGPVFLGRNSTIEDNAEISGFVSAGKNCRITKGCFVKNCILWDNTVIENNSAVTNSIVGKGWIVNANGFSPSKKNQNIS